MLYKLITQESSGRTCHNLEMVQSAEYTARWKNKRHKVKYEDTDSEIGPVTTWFDQIVSWMLGPGLDSPLDCLRDAVD